MPLPRVRIIWEGAPDDLLAATWQGYPNTIVPGPNPPLSAGPRHPRMPCFCRWAIENATPLDQSLRRLKHPRATPQKPSSAGHHKPPAEVSRIEIDTASVLLTGRPEYLHPFFILEHLLLGRHLAVRLFVRLHRTCMRSQRAQKLSSPTQTLCTLLSFSFRFFFLSHPTDPRNDQCQQPNRA